MIDLDMKQLLENGLKNMLVSLDEKNYIFLYLNYFK